MDAGNVGVMQSFWAINQLDQIIVQIRHITLKEHFGLEVPLTTIKPERFLMSKILGVQE